MDCITWSHAFVIQKEGGKITATAVQVLEEKTIMAKEGKPGDILTSSDG